MISSDKHKDIGRIYYFIGDFEKENRLDFDLVSSLYSSFYSFDLVKELRPDSYPSAKDFYQMHKKHYEIYKDNLVEGYVEKIENYNSYSLIYTNKNECGLW